MGEFLTDVCLVYPLAVGYKKGDYEYVSNLYEDYTRRRIANQLQNKTLNESEWANSDDNDLLKNVKNIKISINDSSSSYHEVVKHALLTYQTRILRKFEFNAPHKIDNSLIVVMEYIDSICSFIDGRLKKENTICPFQIDLCCVMGKAVESVQDEHIDGVDDDNDDDDYVDPIGDVKERLESNEEVESIHFASNGDRRRVPHKLQENWASDGEEKECYHQRRFVFLVDQREKKENTENVSIWKDPQKIPKNAVAEYYLASTLDMILPAMKRNAVNDANVDDEKENNQEEKPPIKGNDEEEEKENEEIMEGQSIGARHDCNGETLTLSFVVKEENKRKIYLYWNGMVLPFQSSYLRSIFPLIFNMKYGENAKFIRERAGAFVENLEKWLRA